ncbi:hypothetical protein NPIL_534871 [Nephila pilipes]|uniref:Uncharacterized protein n=1 Tax=Nephila pilipes TaxID=299642 RepID=A0A8X6PKX0_NEPPI|nr:hypothetical protein NPIL_534871 [Nephila pilipes]
MVKEIFLVGRSNKYSSSSPDPSCEGKDDQINKLQSSIMWSEIPVGTSVERYIITLLSLTPTKISYNVYKSKKLAAYVPSRENLDTSKLVVGKFISVIIRPELLCDMVYGGVDYYSLLDFEVFCLSIILKTSIDGELNVAAVNGSAPELMVSESC